MSKSFDELWRFICLRSASFPVVQEYHELEHIFNLIRGCNSYLEIGTAEGNSLYVLSHSLKENAEITYIDWDEEHTRKPRNQIIEMLNCNINPIHGNTHDSNVINMASIRSYDVVLIDAGHKFDDVIEDARNYGKLAKKYIIFHDINLPDVDEAFGLYQKETGFKSYKISNSEHFGYGVMEIK